MFGFTNCSLRAPAFGNSMPAFGASSTPVFGTSSSSFGGSSVFGQKPAFGSSPNQASSFGSPFQQTQSAFGSNLFGSTSFGGSSQPTFGASSTPAFGSASTPAFGATTTPTFGATTAPAFGATTTPSFGSTTTPAFGSTATPLFNSVGAGFGVSNTPSFGSSVTPTFGASSSSLFGSSGTPAFGTSSTPAFGSSTPAFGSLTSPSFGFGSTPSFSQSTSTFGSTPFGTAPSPFGAHSSPFGAQATQPTFGSPGFGHSAFGGQLEGSRVAAYTPSPEADGNSGTQAAGKLESISAMPVYKDKSHEDLRWEDYHRGDKGGLNPSGQPAVGIGFPAPTQASPFGSTGTSGQPAANPFSLSTSSNLFGPKNPTFGSSSFGSTCTSVFNSPITSSSPSPFGGGPSNTGFGVGSSPSTSSFGSGLTFGNTQSSGLFQSSTPSIGQTPSLFGQPSTGFQQTTRTFGSNLFSTPSTLSGGSLFNTSMPSILPTSNPAGFGQATSSLSTAFQMPAPAQTSNAFPFSNFGQTQSGGFCQHIKCLQSGLIWAILPILCSSAAIQSNMVVQPAPITNPFGTLPAMPQMSIGHVGSAPPVQYGISSMTVAEKPNPVRISSLLTPRHLSQRRIRLPARKYHPKSDGQRVPFFVVDEAVPITPKADALFIKRENPRALIVRPIEQWPSRNTGEEHSILKETHPAIQNGQVLEKLSAPAFDESIAGNSYAPPADNNGHNRENNLNAAPLPAEPATQKPNVVHAERTQKGVDSPCMTISGK